MPNHVFNKIVANKEVLDYLKSDESEVDFNKLIQRPEDTDPIFTATKTSYDGMGTFWGMDGYSPVNWARENWGTKWNAYSIDRVSDTEVTFETAWSHPQPIIDTLAEIFPRDVIDVWYADEDLGNNLDHYTIYPGYSQYERFSFREGSQEAVEWACQLRYGKSYEEEFGEPYSE